MPTLRNTTDQPVDLITGHAVPPRGTLTVSEAAWARIGPEGYTRNMMRIGALALEGQPAPVEAATPEPPPLTRETIATARRAELLDILAAHGIPEDTLEGVTVEDRADGREGLRTIAARAVFVDL